MRRDERDRDPPPIVGGPQVPSEPFYWMKLTNYETPSERLNPGGSAKARFMRWDFQSSAYVASSSSASHHGEVTVYDPHKLNFLIPNEIFLARLTSHGRYEIVGSHGLRRKVKITQSGGIAAAASGTASVYSNGAVTSPLQSITVHFNWMDAGTAAENAEAIAQYYRDEDKWTIDELDCAA